MYFDPGFGGMLLQVIVAIVAAGGAILFSLRRKITSLFSKNKVENNTKQTTPMNPNVFPNGEEDIVDVLSDGK